MSSSSYAAWAKFDVEKELERVDETEHREDQEKQQLKQVHAKENVETSAFQAAQQSADVLAAQAAVAALKAKKRVRRGKGNVNEGENSDTNFQEGDGEIEKAAKLQTQAMLFSRKQKLLQQIMENRRLGDAIVRGKEEKKDWKQAKKSFEAALIATKKLEELSPELLKAEEEQTQLLGENESTKANQQDKKHGDCKHESEGHTCGKSCSHGDSKKKKEPGETLPKANDLLAIVKMFYKDVYLGIGTCDLEEGRLAAASEAFKEVLVRDDVHLAAWIKRGEAFERMDAPLLAMLHFNRVVSLDSDHESGKEALERVKAKLLTKGDSSFGTIRLLP
ncbi:hypothetical protein BBO99_00004115 [Phytophthora kernoviae]|uniref:Uncharacterized protein n=1 Tax=Phytophthora kernoviae TaxID=325452 RepID=A0A3R7H0H5_9STRA|nr:hypothetical protein BBI17_004257 [Phytophthora kernoviae]RLN80982.1 hypothetical protein BBO99_00004115 [Phytophthora kernoviae]